MSHLWLGLPLSLEAAVTTPDGMSLLFFPMFMNEVQSAALFAGTSDCGQRAKLCGGLTGTASAQALAAVLAALPTP